MTGDRPILSPRASHRGGAGRGVAARGGEGRRRVAGGGAARRSGPAGGGWRAAERAGGWRRVAGGGAARRVARRRGPIPARRAHPAGPARGPGRFPPGGHIRQARPGAAGFRSRVPVSRAAIAEWATERSILPAQREFLATRRTAAGRFDGCARHTGIPEAWPPSGSFWQPARPLPVDLTVVPATRESRRRGRVAGAAPLPAPPGPPRAP
jgi:hypothetical protein